MAIEEQNMKPHIKFQYNKFFRRIYFLDINLKYLLDKIY